MSEDWPMSFLGITMIALLKKNQAKKCSNNGTISLISHTGKIIAYILTKNLESKMDEVMEDQFGFH